MSYFAIVTPSEFRGAKAKEDVNGKMPVILNPIFGVMPYNRIINGSIAENLGLEFGNSYLVSAVFTDNVNPATGEVRQQIQVTNLGIISTTDLALSRKKFLDQMGAGKVEGAVEASTKPPVTEHEDEDETADMTADMTADGDPLAAPGKK